MTEQTSTPKKMNEVDVAFGYPMYMQEYWTKIQKISDRQTVNTINEGMNYTHAKTIPQLETAIHTLHDVVGNAETKNAEIVIGNGASQLVSAIAYATQKMDIYQILLEPPYWGRLKFLLNSGAGAVGNNPNVCRHHKALINDKYFKFAVSPNNPDGTLQAPEGELSVVDACYYWPQYTRGIKKLDYDVMIFGLSKATGHAGTRIGWAIVKDPKIAELMRDYVEQSTCGVSRDAQKRARTVIAAAALPPNQMASCFVFAQHKLAKRWSLIKHYSKNAPFKILNENGMFVWCSGTPTEGLKVMPGSALGLADSAQYFRMNLGCADDVFEQLIKALDNGSSTSMAGT